MNKIMQALFFSLLFSVTAGAQDASSKRTISLSADAGFYLFSHWVSGTQLNVLAQAQFPIAHKFAVTTTTGIGIAPAKAFYRQSLKEAYGISAGKYLPLWIGGRYYFYKNLHADVDLGADVKISQLASTQFHFSPGIGYAVPVGKSGFFNASTHYITGFKRGTSSFDLRFGYMFPF